MNSNTHSLISKGYAGPALLGLAVFAAELTRAHFSNRSEFIVVPAEVSAPKAANPGGIVVTDEDIQALLDEDDEIEKDTVARTEERLDLILDDEEDDEDEVEELVVEDTPTSYNVFTVDSDWDYEAERSSRSPLAPYVIHADEFFAEEMGFKQEQVTFYEGDQVMASTPGDIPIYGWNNLMGDLRWGHGSKDQNVVYVRNEKERKEWEILLHRGSFAIEILGLDDEGGELKHSLRKFRDD